MAQQQSNNQSGAPRMSVTNRSVPYLKIVLIGDQSVGKTALLDSFEYKKISRTQKPTIGADFMKKKLTLPSGQEVNLQLWDTAGQERFQSLCTSFYRGADCCIVVYDVGAEKTYQNTAKWRTTFMNATSVEEVPVVLVGNKIDQQILVPREQVQEDWVESKLCNAHFHTSALTNEGVDNLFLQTAELALKFQQNAEGGEGNRPTPPIAGKINQPSNSGNTGTITLQAKSQDTQQEKKQKSSGSCGC